MFDRLHRLARRPSAYLALGSTVVLVIVVVADGLGVSEMSDAIAVESASGSAPAPPGRPPATAAPTSAPLPTIALVGDSLLAMAIPQLEQVLAGYDLTFDARPGWTMDMQLAHAVEMAADGPDAMVVVLGANDASPEVFSRTEMERDVARLLDSIDSVPCIRWVTVQEDFYVDGFEEGEVGTLTLNVSLYREASRRPSLEVVDFAPIINEQPDWHVMDLLHLDERGSRSMAELIAVSLDCVR